MSKMKCKIGIWNLASRPACNPIEDSEMSIKIIVEERADRIIKEPNRRNSFVNKAKKWR